MKRILTVVAAMLLVALMAFSVCAADDITVTLNGETVDCASYGQPATIVNGRTLVPLRAIFEALGASVEWDQATKTVTSTLGETTVELTIDVPVMYVNGEGKELDVAGTIMNGRTLVPARAVAEAYGVGVEWEASTRTVILTKSNAPKGALLYNVGGDGFAAVEDEFWGTSNTGIQVVENPTKAGDMVLYMESGITDKAAWNYIWKDVEFVPGQRYLITLSAMAGSDCFGNPALKATIGACFQYDNKDHGVGSGARVYPDKWVNFAVIATIPEEIDATKAMRFGVYASPMTLDGYDHMVNYNIYLDNISVVPYEGDLEDGTIDPSLVMGPTGNGLPANFDFDAAEGMTLDLTTCSSAQGNYDEATGVFKFIGDESKTDPLVYVNAGFDASEYGAVAVKFTKGETGSKALDMQIFFTTTADPNASESKSLHAKYVDCGIDANGNWIAYFDFAGLETADAWTGTIDKLRIDPGNDWGSWDIIEVKVLN